MPGLPSEAMRSSAGLTGDRGRTRPDTARAARDRTSWTRLLRAAQRGDPIARDRLVRTHMSAVRPIGSRYQGMGLPLEDLLQEGALGLLEAIDQYDPRRGASFENYARFRIRRAIRNALTEKGRLIRLPKQIVERRRALEQAEAKLSAAAGGQAPTPAELAAATGLPLAAVAAARAAAVAPISLDEPVLADGGPLANVIADPDSADPVTRVLDEEQMTSMANAMRGLSERERQVVAWRYGFGEEPTSIADAAERLAVSPRRAQTIQRDALYRLRRVLEASRATPA